MDIFEQIALKSITEPIPPEPSPPWLIYAALFLGVVALLLIAFFFRKRLSRVSKYMKFGKKPESVLNIRRAFREYEKSGCSPDKIDFDGWWLLVLTALERRTILDRTDLTIEEFQTFLDHSEAMKMGDRSLFQELTKLIDQHKFGGGLNDSEHEQTIACFREIVKRLGGM